MSIRELEEALEFAQGRVEFYWGEEAPPALRFSERMPPFPGPARCNHEGCNYRRYLASRFCMYHVVGHDTFAEHLRRARARAAAHLAPRDDRRSSVGRHQWSARQKTQRRCSGRRGSLKHHSSIVPPDVPLLRCNE
jgi:hypothetical protein